MLSIFIAAIIWKFLFAKTSEQQQSLTNMTDPNNKDEVITIVDQAKPVFLNLTFGTAMGFCSGFALKKTGKAIAYLIGITFVALQLAVASGYIAVDWKKIEEDAEKRVDYVSDERRRYGALVLLKSSRCNCALFRFRP
jgi:uncharacterized membrane protein (Fun14 family)